MHRPYNPYQNHSDLAGYKIWQQKKNKKKKKPDENARFHSNLHEAMIRHLPFAALTLGGN